MNVHAVVLLSLGLWCSSLAAQQTVALAHASDAPLAPAASSFSPPSSPWPASGGAVPADPALAAGAGVSHISFALPGNAALYESAVPQVPAVVCTQALPPMLTAQHSAYAFDHAQFTTAALKSAFTHDNLVKMARNFVPGQPFPDAPSYVALSSRQKFDLFVHRSHSFDTISGAFIDSVTAQITGAYPSFGGGMAGYGKRLGAATAGAESASFFGTFVFPTLFHQDPRYFRSQQTDISDRLAYAASRVLIGRSDSGRSVINTSMILSQFVQAAVSNAYIPYRRETVPGTVENALTGLGSVAQARILTEFWPDIMMFVSRHEPGVVRKWQDSWNNSSLGQLSKK
jgi:hypothetical protein